MCDLLFLQPCNLDDRLAAFFAVACAEKRCRLTTQIKLMVLPAVLISTDFVSNDYRKT